MKASSDKLLIVFAGPNGAGKSFASQTYLKNLGVSNSAFDWDERFLNLWRQYDFDPMVHSGVRDRINEEFGDYIQQGFKNHEHLAYETNFHHSYNLELIRQALDNNYQVILHYFYLKSIDIAISRVANRVKLGGHAVSKPDIKERFRNGFVQLNEAIKLCQYISIFDYSMDFSPKIILTKSPDKLVVHNKIPLYLFKKAPNLSVIGVTSKMIEKD